MPINTIGDVLSFNYRYDGGGEGDQIMYNSCYDVITVDYIQQVSSVFYYYDSTRRYAYSESDIII